MQARKMTNEEVRQVLKNVGVTPTVQRIAVAAYVFGAGDHPTANDVIEGVRSILPVVSKATVYNSLHTMVKAGLLVEVHSGLDDCIRYDGNTEPHHHLVDLKARRLVDIPFEEIQIANLEELKRKYNLRRITVTMDGEAPAMSAPVGIT